MYPLIIVNACPARARKEVHTGEWIHEVAERGGAPEQLPRAEALLQYSLLPPPKTPESPSACLFGPMDLPAMSKTRHAHAASRSYCWRLARYATAIIQLLYMRAACTMQDGL